jgi:hypothetical protein
MQRSATLFALVFLIFLGCSIVVGQDPKNQLTPDEKKATNEIVNRFTRRLDETGDIKPVINEMFVNDFMARYVKDKIAEVKAKRIGSERILFTSGIEYDAGLLEKASDDDWRRLHISAFNFMQHGYLVMFNAASPYLVAGNEPEDSALEKVVNEMYPRSVETLFDADPILRNFIRKKGNTRSIVTVDELRNVNKTLAAGTTLIRADGKPELRMSEDSIRALKMLRADTSLGLGPYLEVCERECYGFPAGTRLIKIFASPTHLLVITKVGSEYKIVSAIHSSPD